MIKNGHTKALTLAINSEQYVITATHITPGGQAGVQFPKTDWIVGKRTISHLKISGKTKMIISIVRKFLNENKNFFIK
jgi:hypothetical protein